MFWQELLTAQSPSCDARLLTSDNTYLLQAQGKPWEQYLQATLPKRTISLNEIKENFKVFDFLLEDGTWHWAKSSNDERSPLVKQDLPQDILDAFGIKAKGTKLK